MPARQQQAAPDRAPFVLVVLVAVAGSAAALWLRLPGLPVLVVGLTVAGVVHPAPVLTGSTGTGAARRAVPVTRSQRRALARHVRLSALRTLVLPIGLWPVRVCALAGLGAGVVARSLVVAPPGGWPAWVTAWGPWANAAAAFVLVAGLGRVWRTTCSVDEPGPGTPLTAVVGAPRWIVAVVLAGGAAGWAAVYWAAVRAGAHWVAAPGWAGAGGALMGASCAVWAVCRRSAWAGWRLREGARRQWGLRWALVPREEQPPTLVDRVVDGPLTVDTFRSRPGRDLAYYVKAVGALAAAVGGGADVRVLPAPGLDSAGRSIPGTVDPGLFRVAVMGVDADEDQVGDTNLLAAFQWAGRWSLVPKIGAAPVLVERSTVGPYTVDLFDAPGRPSSEMLRMSSRVAVGVGAGLSAVVIPEHEPGGGTHPTRFRVAVCDPGARVDVAVDGEEEVRVHLERFLTEAADYLHQDVAVLRDLHLLTGAGEQVWRVDVGAAAERLVGYMGQIAPALLDGETIILGDTEGASWVEAGMAGHVADLRVAAEWTAHFEEVIKAGDRPPAAQVAHMDELDASGVRLHRLPFASPQGKDIARDYLPLGQRLRTTMARAPFVLITAVAPTEGAAGAGDRSDKFFEVVWSERPVAAGPADLPPSREASRSRIDPRDGAALVLAGMVDTAFRAVFGGGRVPQTVDAECLTVSAPWIWRVRIRLYGGLSLADLRARADKIAAGMRAEWLRVRGEGDLVEIFVGARPMAADIAPQWERTVAELDFEQAWADAGTITPAGEVPAMVSSSSLDGNDEVNVYTFALPPGLAAADVRAGLDKIASTTRAGFLQVVAQPDPSRVVLMSAERNPIPVRAPYDFAAADALVSGAGGVGGALRIPWGTGVDGRPVTWGVGDTAHALVLGITGTGKSVTLLAAVYTSLLAGWDVIVVDPVKGGADFAPLRPWLRGLGGQTVARADAMMKAVWAEVRRRKELAAARGVPGVDGLPDGQRPPHVLVVVDEFTSLMLVEAVRRVRTADPDVLAEWEQAERENARRASIGSLTARIAREARSSGVHLVLGTQVLKADTIGRIPGGDLKNNLGRLLLGSPTWGERMSGLRQPELAPALTQAPVGRGVWEATTSAAVEVQTWFAAAGEYAAQLKARGVPARDDWDVNAFMPEEESAAYTEIELDEDGGAEMLDEFDPGDLDLGSDGA